MKFIPIPEVDHYDPDDGFYCIGCSDWTAHLAIVNDDDTWLGYACCGSEACAHIALAAHNAASADGEEPSDFWEDGQGHVIGADGAYITPGIS